MRVVVPLEFRFSQTPDGNVWTRTTFPHAFWTRYLDVFSEVRIVARAQLVERVPEDWKRVNGEGVHFLPVPYYTGPLQYARRRNAVRRAIAGAADLRDALVLRVASQISTLLLSQLHPRPRPYGVEVVSDPYDVFSPKSVDHPLRPFFRWWFTRQLRRQCRAAAACAYVTRDALQRRYPAAEGAFQTHYSSIDLKDDAFVDQPRAEFCGDGPVRIITIGTLSQAYKGIDTLISAVALCRERGVDVTLTIVGDGALRAKLEQQAAGLGVQPHVCFTGELPAGEAVRSALDRADLFALASRQEGLPRAMIEAMARAVPCLGTPVGGIPELLDEEDLFPPNDPHSIAQRIQQVIESPGRMRQMSARCLSRAHAYHERELRSRRIAFYGYLRERTEEWIRSQGGRASYTSPSLRSHLCSLPDKCSSPGGKVGKFT